MPVLSVSRQATREYDQVRQQMETLVQTFNTSIMDLLSKYHKLTLENCQAELTSVKAQLTETQRELAEQQRQVAENQLVMAEQQRALLEQQREMDYRSGVIMRLEREKVAMQTEMENRVQEARKIANFERLDLRPSPFYTAFNAVFREAQQIESEPEASHGSNSRDLESVISRLKKQKNPRQVTKRRHTQPEQPEAPRLRSRSQSQSGSRPPSRPDDISVLSQGVIVPNLAAPPLAVPELGADDRASTVTVTEQTVMIKQELEMTALDVDDNDVDVLEKAVKKPDTPPLLDSGIDTVDDAPSTSTSEQATSTGSPAQQINDTASETSQEPARSDTSDTERSTTSTTNNNDDAFINRQYNNIQLSLPLKKRKPPPNKKAIVKKNKKVEKAKPKPRARRVKALSTDSRASTDSAISVDSAVSVPPISDDEITPPLPDSTTTLPTPPDAVQSAPEMAEAKPKAKPKQAVKRKRGMSVADVMVDKIEVLPPRRCTQPSRKPMVQPTSDSELDDADLDPDFNPEKEKDVLAEDDSLEIGVVHASNTPILAARPDASKTKSAKKPVKPKAAKVKRSRSLGTPRTKPEKKAVHYDCTRCPESFTDRNLFRQHVENHGAKKRKVSAAAGKTKAAKTAIEPMEATPSVAEKENVENIPSTPDVKPDKALVNKMNEMNSTPTGDQSTPKTSTVPTKRSHPAGTGIQYRCNQCPASFKFKYCLDNHRAVHTHDHPFKCYDCTASFRTEKGLHDHSQVHKTLKNSQFYKCNKCPQKFQLKQELTEHISLVHASRVVDSEAALLCIHCNEKFMTPQELQDHLDQHKNDRTWKCAFCPSTFRWKGSLDVHMARHQDDPQVQSCAQCGVIMCSKAQLIEHINSEHMIKFEVLSEAEAITQAMGDMM